MGKVEQGQSPNLAVPRIQSLKGFVFRAPIAHPVRTSFGIMSDRPALLVCIEDAQGATGWGEAWCNFPPHGAEHRLRLIENVLAPLLLGRGFESPEAAGTHLMQATRILCIQTGEFGPFAQAIAAIDIALWDLVAQRAGQPLWALLGGSAAAAVPAYASGISPEDAQTLVPRSREAGFSAFKLKVGFDAGADIATVDATAKMLDHKEELMVDANQAWDVDKALRMLNTLSKFPLRWLEEPLPADSPPSHWQTLAQQSELPLAAGENLVGEAAFETVVRGGWLDVVQPDVCKWGGISQCLGVARRVLAAGKRYCPHYLGGGIGLLASAHLLAAVGGDGRLEVDVNPNPLRVSLAQPFPQIRDGKFKLPSEPGLGAIPDLEGCQSWLVLQVHAHT